MGGDGNDFDRYFEQYKPTAKNDLAIKAAKLSNYISKSNNGKNMKALTSEEQAEFIQLMNE
jgi:hypothetical protein